VSNTLKLLESTFSYIPADKGLNFIVCKEFKETFLNVYELVIAGKNIIAECVDTIDSNPVIKINVEYNDKSYDALFVVREGDDNIIFNPATLRHGSKILQTEKNILKDIAADDIVITEDIVENIVRPDVKLDIEKYKRDALKIIGENYIDKKSKIEDLKVGLVSLIEKNLSDIKSASVTDINTIKTQLHESVTEQVNNYRIDTDTSITEINSIRENVLATVDLYVDNIKQVVSEKTEALTSLQESVIYSINEKIAELDIVTENHRKEVEAAFTGLSQLANSSSVQLAGMVGEIYEDVTKVKQTTIDEVNAELTNVTASVNSKLKDLQSTADKKISSISKLVESKISELQTEKDKTHVELIAAKNELVTSLQEAIKTFETETADKTAGLLEIKHQFLEQVKVQSDTINAAVNENKQEIQTLTTKITEAVEEKIKKINLVATKKEDLAQLKKQLEQRIDAESANIKKVLSSYGGGGSVAAQYAKGGTMNGSLNIATGQILSGGIDISTLFSGGGGVSGAYLPLSGGTVTGVLSTTNVIYASGGNSNQWNSTYSTVQTNSGSWNPAGSYLPLYGGTLTGTLTINGFPVRATDGNNLNASLYSNRLEFEDRGGDSDASVSLVMGAATPEGTTISLPNQSGQLLTNVSNLSAANLTGTIANARLPVVMSGLSSVASTTFVGRLSGTASDNLPLTGGTLTGVLSTTNVIYASGGNSNQWNSSYTTVQSNSATWGGGGGGLTIFSEVSSVTSPNNIVPTFGLSARSLSANVDFAIIPKGTGAFILGPIPDSTGTGGNKRGQYAVDLQISKSATASRVASGNYSFLAGLGGSSTADATTSIGQGNLVTSNYAVGLGYGNTASGLAAISLGYSNSNSGTVSVALGQGHTTSNNRSYAIGYSNTASGDASGALGDTCTASAKSALATGLQSQASRYGQKSHSAGQFAAVGDAQSVQFVVRNKTTNNTATTLFLDGASTRLTIPSGRILSGTINIVGSKSDGTAVARYLRQVTIKNVAGTTSLVGSVVTLGTDEATGTSISITADDTNDALSIQVTGVTAETWRWVATVEGVELAYGV